MENKDLKIGVVARLLEFKDYCGMSLNSFCAALGMGHTTVFNQVNGNRSLSLDTVLNTLNTFSELSTDWLLRGRGDMLISKFNDTPESIKLRYDERIESLLDTIKLLNETINAKDSTIDALKEELAKYKSSNTQKA